MSEMALFSALFSRNNESLFLWGNILYHVIIHLNYYFFSYKTFCVLRKSQIKTWGLKIEKISQNFDMAFYPTNQYNVLYWTLNDIRSFIKRVMMLNGMKIPNSMSFRCFDWIFEFSNFSNVKRCYIWRYSRRIILFLGKIE